MTGTLVMLAAQPQMTTSWFEIALVIFMVVFLAIVVWVLAMRGEYFRKASRIPLEDERIVTPREMSKGDAAEKDTNHGR